MTCTYIAGYHDLRYDPFRASGPPQTIPLGETGPEGIRVNREILQEDITSDSTGPNAIRDGIFQGQNMEIEFILQSLNLEIAQRFLHPWQTKPFGATANSVDQHEYGQAGRLVCSVIGTLDAIPRAGTPAASFTAGSAGTPSGASGRRYKGIVIGTLVETLDNTLRAVPVRFRCYPYLNSEGVRVMWEWITPPA